MAATGRAPAHGQAREPVRVMVVDDSVVIRGLVARWIEEDPELNIVAKCANGQIAVDKMPTAKPDVIILDIEMPVMDGMTALPLLLAARPKPHIIIASTLTKRNAAITLKALSQGASECLPKPDTNSAVTTSTDFRRDLLAKVRALGGLTTSSARKSEFAKPGVSVRSAAAGGGIALVPFTNRAPRILAIGSSTGGPQALSVVLSSIGSLISSIPIVVTQHMPATFTAMLAEGIGKTTGRPSKEAESGELAEPGSIYVAPGGKHLVMHPDGTRLMFELDDRRPVNFCKPSVDVMFESLAAIKTLPVLAVVLTGMGQDGAVGAVSIRKAGGNVIAQDEATSVVWGMPGATAEAGCCSAVLPLDQIGPKIGRIIAGRFA